MTMAFNSREGTKIDGLLLAMRASRAAKPIWTQAEAADNMGVPRANVPAFIAAACNGGALFRRTTQRGLELSLERFPAHAPAPLTASPAPAAAESAPRFGAYTPPEDDGAAAWYACPAREPAGAVGAG